MGVQIGLRKAGLVGVGMLWWALGGVACSGGPTDAAASRSVQPDKTIVEGMACPVAGEVEPHYILSVLLDRTGSYFTDPEVFGQMKRDAIRYMRETPPGTLVLVSYISDASQRREELALSDTIPEALPETCIPANIFDAAQQRACKAAKARAAARQRCIEQAHQRMEDAIADLTPVTAKRTDVDGGFMMVQEVFQSFPKAEHAVVVMSDGADNVNKRRVAQLPGLAGSKVVLRPPLGNGKIGEENPIDKYRTVLESSGADVSVIPMSIPVSAKLFEPVSFETGKEGDRARVVASNP